MRNLVWGSTFVRAYKRALRKHPEMEAPIAEALRQLQTDPFDPSLETHKLKGGLAGAWACGAEYDLLIVFHFVSEKSKAEKDILLIDIGTHDEVC